jgi:hypothetical protein
MEKRKEKEDNIDEDKQKEYPKGLLERTKTAAILC